MGRPKEHDEKTRQRLLDAAGKVLRSDGLGALSARRVAAEADVSTRAIYSLFGGMPGLLARLYTIGNQELVRLHEAVPRERDAAAEIVPLALAYRQGALEHPLYGLAFERALPPLPLDESEYAVARRALERVHDATSRALQQRGLDERDSRQVVRQLWAVVHGLAALELQGELGDPVRAEQSWRDTTAAVVAGFFPGRPLPLGVSRPV